MLNVCLYFYIFVFLLNIPMSPNGDLVCEKTSSAAPLLYLPLLGNCLYLHFYNILICIYCIYISRRIIALASF